MMNCERATECPFCGGKGYFHAFVNRGEDSSKHSFDQLECDKCCGTGEVPVEYMSRLIAGRVARQERISRGETLNDAANRLGISPAELSARENGWATADKAAPDPGAGVE